MATLRNGLYGSYYGSAFNESEPLTTREMETNAEYIYKYLHDFGWSDTAIAGMLGNMQAESTINPGRWQSEDVGNTSMGYGLVQWTPATKYIEWCNANGITDPSTMDANIQRILYEVKNGIQWIATSNYNFSFQKFTTSQEDPDYLAKAFLLNYERPADQSGSVQEYRSELARKWDEYLIDFILNGGSSGGNEGGSSGGNEGGTTTTKKRKKFNFVLFGANKRRQGWIR